MPENRRLSRATRTAIRLPGTAAVIGQLASDRQSLGARFGQTVAVLQTTGRYVSDVLPGLTENGE